MVSIALWPAAWILRDPHAGTARSNDEHETINRKKRLKAVEKRKQELIDAMLTVLIEFQKSQCYFAAAIQIAAIIFLVPMINLDSNDFLDAGFMFAIASNGYIPVVFNLICIGLSGRPSWYMIGLSSASFALSTTTLVLSHLLWGRLKSIALDLLHPDENGISACGGHTVRELQNLYCGSSFPHRTPPSASVIESPWNWILWAICAIWLLYSVIQRLLTESSFRSYLDKLADSWDSVLSSKYRLRSGLQIFMHSRLRSVTYYGCFIASWTCAFGYQFYLYRLFFTRSEGSIPWSFGQIVPVTDWAPFLAELLNLLKSQYCSFSRSCEKLLTLFDIQTGTMLATSIVLAVPKQLSMLPTIQRSIRSLIQPQEISHNKMLPRQMVYLIDLTRSCMQRELWAFPLPQSIAVF